MTTTPQDLSHPSDPEPRVEEIVRNGPRGALTVVGLATAIVVAIWFLFYLLIFVPRGVIH